MSQKEKKLAPIQRLFRMLKPDKREIYNIYIYIHFSMD